RRTDKSLTLRDGRLFTAKLSSWEILSISRCKLSSTVTASCFSLWGRSLGFCNPCTFSLCGPGEAIEAGPRDLLMGISLLSLLDFRPIVPPSVIGFGHGGGVEHSESLPLPTVNPGVDIVS